MERYRCRLGAMINTSEGEWVEYAEIEALRAIIARRQETINVLCDQNRELNAEIGALRAPAVQFHHYITGDGAEFAGAIDAAVTHVKSLNEPYDVHGAVEIGHTERVMQWVAE